MNDNREIAISETTRQRVIETAQRIGYKQRSHPLEKSRGETSPFIGFMIDEIATSVFGSISIEAAQEAAWESGYLLDLAMTRHQSEYEQRVLTRWIEDGVTGVIYGSILTRQIESPDELDRVNSVLLNCYSKNKRKTAILPAEIMGGFVATEALIKRGCKRIAFIGGEEWMEAAQDRLKGYRNAMASYQLPIDSTLIKISNFMPSGGYQATCELLNLPNRPQGIFCANDLMAVGAFEAIKEAGLKIPQDIAVVGYDDQEIAGHLNPPLSTVLLPHGEMGRWAVNYLLTTKESPYKETSVKLECPYIERASC